MSSQREYERRWIKYARKVLSTPCGCNCDGEISWPGYIGKDYHLGRVLLVGAIHNDPVLRKSGILEIIPKVEAFKRATPPQKDQLYIDAVRKAYLQAIPKWATYVNEKGRRINNTVWAHLLSLLDAFGIPLTQFAFTNLAKCALPAGAGWAIERRRIKGHESVTPISALIQSLEPRYVLIAKERRDLPEILGLKSNPLILRFCNNRTFSSELVPFETWKRKDAIALKPYSVERSWTPA
jgi:hypothetical protein